MTEDEVAKARERERKLREALAAEAEKAVARKGLGAIRDRIRRARQRKPKRK